MTLPLALYRCRNKILIATDAKMVSDHINNGYAHHAPVTKMPVGSVILHNNEPYGVPELTTLAHKFAKIRKIKLNKPFSIIIDDRFIK